MADKRDLNAPVASSISDVLPGTLGERQARSYRQSKSYYRGTAVAVVGDDGAVIGGGLEEILGELLHEIRALRLGMVLAGTAEDIDILA